MSKRKFPSSIKSLLHFDYPYFNEPNDGLEDEIGLETWTKNGTVSLYGSVIPKAGTLAPKFGYRCLRTYKGSIRCNNESGIWNFNSSGRYEIEFFLQFANVTQAQNIFSLMDTGKSNEILKLSLLATGNLAFEASSFGVDSISGTTVFVKNTWYHILIRLSGNRMRIYLDGKTEINTILIPGVAMSVGQVIIGNNKSSYNVYIDEFVFRHSAGRSKPVIPTEPLNGYLDETTIGGYGSGSDGDKVITEDITLNTCGTISEVNNTTKFTVSSITEGDCIFSSGSEVLIHVTAPLSTTVAEYPYTGLYEFRKITSISSTENGKSITLDKSIDTEKGDNFTLDNTLLETYKVQVISVPNYNTLTIKSEATVTPTNESGIVIFRCKGDCTINGKILTSGYGLIRYDMIQMTHSKMIDRFMITKGGGICIVCGGTLRLDENARLGASWSGLGEDYNGAAGYGGSSIVGYSLISGGVGGGAGGRGGFWTSGSATSASSSISLGGSPGSQGDNDCFGGAGGGGGCGGKGGDLRNGMGSDSYTNVAGSGGGCQGEIGGHIGEYWVGAGSNLDSSKWRKGNPSYGCNGGHGLNGGGATRRFSGGGGGGAGGNGGNSYGGTGGYAGSCVVIVSNKASIPEASISTGGQRGTYQTTTLNSGKTGSAGGTGFCYMAVGELLDE